MVAPVGRDGGEGKTGMPFGGKVTLIVTGLDAAGWLGVGRGAGGGVGRVALLSLFDDCRGALDGGAAKAGWDRGWKNERMDDCWGRDMFRY